MAWSREQMVRRAAAELRAGDCVSLGRGLPLPLAEWIEAAPPVWLLSEQGLYGPGVCVDSELADAAELQSAGVLSNDAFAIIHGGHVDVAIVDARQVSEQGDLATACTPGTVLDGGRYLIDLVARARRVVVVMAHMSLTGEHKLVSECDQPVIGIGVVSRVITELGVVDVTPHGLQLVELAEGVSLSEISAKTAVALNLVVDLHPGFA